MIETLRSVLRFRRVSADPVVRQLARAANVEDLRRIAKRRLPRGVFDYIDGGAEDERTMAANHEGFSRLTFRPRVLRDVSAVDPSTTLLGRRLPLPLVLAPTGFTRIADPEGELAVARAAARAEVPYSLSTLSTRSIEEVAAVSDGPKWFQVYVWRDRGLVKEMVDRAASAGFEALVLTVDSVVLGSAPSRDVRRGFELPPKIGLGTLVDGAIHPGWTWAFVRAEPIRFANVVGRSVGDGADAVSLAAYVAAQYDQALTWGDVEWLRSIWPGPLVVKGIQTVDERLAADAGVEAVALSNHGGRQLDGAPAPIDLVAPVADAVGDRIEVICDGGVRRGSDIVKAVALGARAVMAGRAYLYGLGAAGERGVDHVLGLLDADVRRTMALLGAPTVDDLGRHLLDLTPSTHGVIEPMPDANGFPPGFLWGTATAAHQIEGGNWNNDWWALEHQDGSPTREPSGDRCDSYHRWAEDADLVAELGFGTYRSSLEWSRIEPEEGEFSRAAIDHYRRVCDGYRERGVEPVVTFHHFTTPRWLAAKGGWERPDTADAFARFCEWSAERLGDSMARACTINEPNIVSFMGWGMGMFPPGSTEITKVPGINDVFVDAHRKSVDAIRSGAPGVPVGLTLAMSEWTAVDGGEANLARLRRRMEDVFLEATEGDDFIGVQTYSRTRVSPDAVLGPEPGVPTLIMGYEYWPQSLEATIRYAWEVTGGKVPVLVNGIGTEDDGQRLAYLHAALEGVLRTIADGIDVRGYRAWSLLDNFEWTMGYGPKFGIVACDRTTFERTPKASARWFSEVARANALLPIPS